MSKISTRIEKMKIEDLKLLDVNARFMRHETFQQLVSNVKRDGTLTSVPFAIKDEDGKYKVLSGNHRVMAAKEAGLKEVPVLITDDHLTYDEQVAIQLSHNSIVGEDDPEILRQLYESIEDLDLKEYSGLDDKTLDLLGKVEVASFNEPNLDFQSVSLLFLPDEKKHVEEVLKEALSLIPDEEYWLARWGDYDDFINAITNTMMSYDTHNVATALTIILQVFKRHVRDLREGWWDEKAEKAKTLKHVPLVTIVGDDTLAPSTAATINRAVEKMISRGEIQKNESWRAFEIWAEDYLKRS